MKPEKQQILDWLYSLHRFGIQPGLERIKELLISIGNPENQLKVIHITGTNGKGTTAVTISSILLEAGYKVGLYTSPHLVDFNERIQINGELIPDDVLVDLAKSLKHEQEKIGATFFELTTAIAFKYFADQKVDFAVIEAGMGGLNDATNVLNPLLSIITPISLEHQEYLGDTLEKIAEDKAGIIKPKSRTIISDTNINLQKIFSETAIKRNNKLVFLDNQFKINSVRLFKNYKINISFSQINSSIPNFIKSPFLGEHQTRNVLTAYAAIKTLNEIIPIRESIIRKGITKAIENFQFLGRFQIYSPKPLIILDVAHNPAAFEKLIANIENLKLTGTLTLVLALMADKDIESIIKIISGKFSNYIITKPKIERAAEPEFIKQKLIENSEKAEIDIINFVSEATKYILREKKPTLFAGSFYLIGEVLEALKESKS